MKQHLFLAIVLLSSCIAFSQQKNTKTNTATQKVIESQGVTDLCDSYYVYYDNDRDGYGTGTKICYDIVIDEGQYATLNGDCNDNDPNVTISRYWYLDNDGDGFGSTSTASMQCTPPNASYKALGGDCNDSNAAIHPNTKWYRDADNDTFGNAAVFLTQCAQPAGYVLNNADCNDGNAAIHPNTKWYRDADNDTYGNPTVFLTQCAQPAGYVLNNTDCNDNSATQTVPLTWYADADADGFGDPASTTSACIQPSGYVNNNLDLCPASNGTFQGCPAPTTTTGFGNDKNYIITIAPKKPVTNIANIANSADVNVGIVYYDEIGRPMQQIANGQSATGKDIVTHIEYDAQGRQVKNYLPYPSTQNSMQYIAGATAQSGTLSHYQGAYNEMNPYSEKLFEASPLNKVLKQAAPGNDWAMGSGHEVKLAYDTNSGTEVKQFLATATWNATSGLYDIAISNPGNYAASQLMKTVTKNENWTSGVNNTTEEFKNKEDQVVLKRNYNSGTTHDTYYVYDQYGNLTYVIPPLADGAFDTSTLDGLCYQYKYDNRNRLVEKKLPGKQWEFMVYDKLDRIVATGPVFSPFSSPSGTGWMVTKYDVFNRAILTAWQSATVNSAQRTALQNSYNAASLLSEARGTTTVNSVSFNYTNTVQPTTNYHVLTVNYYDDYAFPGVAPIPSTVLGQPVYYNSTRKPKGLLTGSWIRIPETGSTPIKAEMTSVFYDEKARSIQTKLVNHLSGYAEMSVKLDFSGKTLQTVTKHKKDGGASPAEITVTEDFTYSAQDRLLTHTHQIGTSPKQLLVSNVYDEMGLLVTEKVGGSDALGITGLQKVDFKYNIRGWLKEINNVDNLIEGSNPKDLFAYKVNYNDNLTTGLSGQETAVSKLYNGNISEVFWTVASDDKKKKYGYNYDDLNRLKDALYQEPGASAPATGAFNENVTYDKNGNILTMQRNEFMQGLPNNPTIDNLVYSYNSVNKNQLDKVADNSFNTNGFKDGANTNNDYGYDANGNMIADANKGITNIIYNHLNLPTKIVFGNGTIDYLYNATGQKVEKKVSQTGQAVKPTLYLGGFQYVDGLLEFFPTAKGYVKYNAGNFSSYVFNYNDHLGNVRMSYKDNMGVLQIVEESNYYPFGLRHSANPLSGSSYKYAYNGKELQNELGLNFYDFHARNYDPALGRWMNIDPLAEYSKRWSPYNYTMNNPIYYIDPDGNIPLSVIQDLWDKSGDGATTWTFNDNGTATKSNGSNVNVSDENTAGDAGGDNGGDGNGNDGKKDGKGGKGGKGNGGKPSYTPPPKKLPGFPDAEKVKPKGGRPRWKLPDGDIVEWDGQHGELERYNKRGKHKGVWSPEGEQIKDPVPGRTIDPYVTTPPPPSSSPFMQKMSEATGFTGTALIIYIVISEGSRLFPPRNLVPIP